MCKYFLGWHGGSEPKKYFCSVFLVLDSAADSMAGRIDLLELPPSCWGKADGPVTHSIFENQSSPLQLKKAQRELASFLVYGGFPEVVSHADPKMKMEILTNYKNTYFTRDLGLLSNIENISGLRAILNHYALSLGSITQIGNFQNEAGVSAITAKKYLNSVYQSGLGFTLLGYHFGPAKRFVKGSKSYYCDSGVITALHAKCSRGQTIENFVISEFEKRRKLGFYKTDQLFFYKSSSGFEIDLIIDEGDLLNCIEIKSTINPTQKDTRNLERFLAADPGKKRGFLFYMGTEYQKLGNILCLPIAALYRGR